MLFSIHYVTEYSYSEPVTDNLNALRVRPATTATQRCDEFHVRIDPETRLGRHADYFGTEVVEFGISGPHTALTIDVRARVVTSEPVLRLSRVLADLDFRGRVGRREDVELLEVCEIVGRELALADTDIADRYFGGVAMPIHVN